MYVIIIGTGTPYALNPPTQEIFGNLLSSLPLWPNSPLTFWWVIFQIAWEDGTGMRFLVLQNAENVLGVSDTLVINNYFQTVMHA